MSHISIPVEKLDEISDALIEAKRFQKDAVTREQVDELVEKYLGDKFKGEADRKISFASGSPSAGFYQKLFGGAGLRVAPRSDGFKDFYGFADQLARRVNSDDITKALNEGLPSDGGALVPEEFTAEIFNIAVEEAVTLNRVRSYGMKSDTKKIPGVTIGSHANNLFGGMIGFWVGESDTLTEANPEYRSIELKASKLTVLGKASSEWDSDAVGGREGLKVMMGQALGWYLDDAFINGTGAGQPLGVMNSPCLITQAKDAAQTADTITYHNLTKMESRLHPASWNKAVWVAHPTCMPQLRAVAATLTASGPGAVGNVEGVIVAVTPSMGKDGKHELFGRPLIISEKVQPLGDKGDIMLCDFSQYGVGMRKDLRLEASKDMYFTTDEIAYRGIIRVDGQPLWDDVLTLKDGTHTVSPFVVLEERAT